MGLAIILGFIGKFYLAGGFISLVGIVIFIMPLFLKPAYLLITVPTTVVIVDAISGFLSESWISVIAYTTAVLIIMLTKIFKFKVLYMVGVLIGGAVIIVGYYLGETILYDHAYAKTSLIPNLIEFGIVIPVVWMIYFPMKIVSKII